MQQCIQRKNFTQQDTGVVGIDRLLSKLDIHGKEHGEGGDFPEQLRATEFTVFHPVTDYGYFSFKAFADYKSLSSI